MNTTQTIYNGSEQCRCGKVLTPLEALYGDTCQACRGKQIRALINGGMVQQD